MPDFWFCLCISPFITLVTATSKEEWFLTALSHGDDNWYCLAHSSCSGYLVLHQARYA